MENLMFPKVLGNVARYWLPLLRLIQAISESDWTCDADVRP